MNYCTLDDIEGHVPEARLVEVTDDNSPNSTGTIKESVVNKAIEESSNLIDAYIGKRFRLPLPGVPSVIKMVCVDLSICKLYERVTEMNVPEGMQLRYKNALSLLKGIAEGDVSIGVAPDEGIDESGFKVVSSGNRPMFTMDSMSFL